jgi:hypothetical protein
LLLCTLLFGCDSNDTIEKATPTPQATPTAPIAKVVPDGDLIDRALTASDAITRYHYSMSHQMTITDTNGVRDNYVELDGLILSATDGYVRHTLPDGRVIESLGVDGRGYQKLATDAEWQDYSMITPTLPKGFPTFPPNSTPVPSPTALSGIRQLIGGGVPVPGQHNFKYQGEQSIDGTDLYHFQSVEYWGVSGHANTMSYWIDAHTGYISKFEEERYFPPSSSSSKAEEATPTSDQFTRIHIVVVIDRYNDPSIALPRPLPTPHSTP